jgi:hypothetical protein
VVDCGLGKVAIGGGGRNVSSRSLISSFPAFSSGGAQADSYPAAAARYWAVDFSGPTNQPQDWNRAFAVCIDDPLPPPPN